MRLLIAAIVVSALAGWTAAANAADDPTGTWKWSITRNNNTFETTLKLKLEGDKLTGTVSGRNNQDIAIEDASFKDGTVTFSVTREFNNQKRTTKYSGKLSGDTIKGTSESERDGQKQSRDWEAKRSK